ncbi:pyocin knob domain-containing protein [Cytobacillus sp.]|uniref:pyocin knob domain-containing protein n=1 Tax=Cytobacillus sp. TaxID=2675269 RepID=UPI003516CB0E
MEIEILNHFNTLKQGDTKTEFSLKLLDFNREPLDLEGKTTKVLIANNTGKILEKTPTIDETDVGVIHFKFSDADVTGFGDMRLEIHVTDAAGDTQVIPSSGYYKFTIDRNLNDLSDGITSYSLEYFIAQLDEKELELDEARDAALEAAGNVTAAVEAANTAADEANAQALHAKTQGDYALQQGDIAATEASNLSTLKTDVQTATTNANNAATSAIESANNANTKATEAETAASNANAQATFAQDQGDYAKAQGDYAKQIADDISSSAGVTSVNGKTGAVSITSADITMIPRKLSTDPGSGYPNGVTMFDVIESTSEGYPISLGIVINYKFSNLRFVQFMYQHSSPRSFIRTWYNDAWSPWEELEKVQSVNGKTGAITLNAGDVGAETPAGAQAKIDTAIAGLIDGAPGALDTLKELADAMGDDPNFATTVLNRLTTIETESAAHSAESMPHKFTDAIDLKTYRYGFQTNTAKDGLVFVYEEVL